MACPVFTVNARDSQCVFVSLASLETKEVTLYWHVLQMLLSLIIMLKETEM